MVHTVGKVIPQGVKPRIPALIPSQVFPELLIQGVIHGIGDHPQGPVQSFFLPGAQQPGYLFHTPYCRVVGYKQVVIEHKLVAKAVTVTDQCDEHDEGEEKIPQTACIRSFPFCCWLWCGGCVLSLCLFLFRFFLVMHVVSR
jgi:hypothetical protein